MVPNKEPMSINYLGNIDCSSSIEPCGFVVSQLGSSCLYTSVLSRTQVTARLLLIVPHTFYQAKCQVLRSELTWFSP